MTDAARRRHDARRRNPVARGAGRCSRQGRRSRYTRSPPRSPVKLGAGCVGSGTLPFGHPMDLGDDGLHQLLRRTPRPAERRSSVLVLGQHRVLLDGLETAWDAPWSARPVSFASVIPALARSLVPAVRRDRAFLVALSIARMASLPGGPGAYSVAMSNSGRLGRGLRDQLRIHQVFAEEQFWRARNPLAQGPTPASSGDGPAQSAPLMSAADVKGS